MTKLHSFHIPVMGIGFTIDSPLKVSKYGIDSVISLVDDILLEKLRKMYCSKYERTYIEISEKAEDFRAKRITAYLNLIQELALSKFEELKNFTSESTSEVKKYIAMLPDSSKVKQELNIPIIVGGGIRSKTELDLVYKAGADLVVIGTAFEEDESFINELKK